jgi:hypothetical protein
LERARARLVTEIEACTAGVLASIAPLKQCEADTDRTTGAQTSSVSHVTDDAEEALTMLITTMERALSAPNADIEPPQSDTRIGGAMLGAECLREQGETDAAG